MGRWWGVNFCIFICIIVCLYIKKRLGMKVVYFYVEMNYFKDLIVRYFLLYKGCIFCYNFFLKIIR